MYKRKTEDEFHIEAYYLAYGWEMVTIETNRKDAREQIKTYRKNLPGQYRIIKKRVPL